MGGVLGTSLCPLWIRCNGEGGKGISVADTISKTWESLVSDKKRRVLFIVDGDASYLYYTGMLLQRLNYNIYTTRMAEEALAIMKFAVPMLVLTEISLQGMDGIELLRQIKQNPKTQSVPVIIYTASTEQSLKYICQDAGCDAFLRKPFDTDELYAAIQGAIGDKPRRYVRLQTCLSVMMGEDAKRAHVMTDCVTALSDDGMYVSTSKPMAVGTHIPLTLFLGKTHIKIQGTVLYSFDVGRGPLHTSGMGVKFTHIKNEDRMLIRAYIKKELTKVIAQNSPAK